LGQRGPASVCAGIAHAGDGEPVSLRRLTRRGVTRRVLGFGRAVITRRALGFGRGVYIVGVHRSGTSAITRTVNLMGVPLSDPHDLIDAVASSNPTGHWESGALLEMNDRVLAALGGTWSAPPILPPGWEQSAAVAHLRPEARRLFGDIYKTRRWAWKDPRICLTLPFWRSCTAAEAVAILVVRNPLEIANSLKTRNGFPVRYGLALWERYMRIALGGMVGLPVLVTDYDGLLRDSIRWCTQVSSYLLRHGFPVSQPNAAELALFLNPELRHIALGVDALSEFEEATDSQRELFRALRTLAGTHEPMPRLELPPESPSTEVLIASRRAAVSTGDHWVVPAG
jgi:hypothetical protein